MSTAFPNKIHVKGNKSAWTIDITVPKTIRTTSKPFANLNCAHVKREKEENAESCLKKTKTNNCGLS